MEEIEHSLTLDDTRQMAETWQRKHASSLDAVGESPQEQGNGVHGAPPSGRAQTGRPGEEDEEDSCTEGGTRPPSLLLAERPWCVECVSNWWP